MTPHALLRRHCGLSIREAADFHGVRLDTVQSWSTARRGAPAGAMAELRALAALLDLAAEQTLTTLETVPPAAEIEIGYPADDHEARALGLPCVGAWAAMLGRVLVDLDRPVRLVPRGSTPATAAAIDAHEKTPGA